jgi:flagellar biosynthesis GTPase FlhF
LAYYAAGQNVPDDLEVPDARTLSEKITKSLLG